MLAADSGYVAFFSLLGVVVVGVCIAAAVRAARAKGSTLREEVSTRDRELRGARAELEQLRARADRGTAVTVLLDEHEIKQACLKLREGAAAIRGSWCSKYKRDEIVAYFNQEHADLMANPDLTVHRTVNPSVVGEAWDEFYDLWSRSQAQDRWKIKLNSTISDAELLHVEYADGRAPVGVLVINEVRETAIASDPALGLIFDPLAEKWLRHGVNFIERWLDQISSDPNSEPLTRDYTRTWGGPVPGVYDRCVWRNPDLPEFFKGYIREEQRMLIELLKERATETSGRVTVVEVGCGTARALIRCATPDLVDKLQYLIGFDSSDGMIAKAEGNLREAIADHEGDVELEILHRVRFTLMDALAMNLHMKDGSLLSPEGSHFPGIGLKWTPEGDLDAFGVDQYTYYESPKVFCCMLNTLGVFSDERRLAALENVVRATRVGDCIAISLLDGARFRDGARLFYEKIREVTQAGEEHHERYIDQDASFRTTSIPRYWSRWMFEAPPAADQVADSHTVRGMLRDLSQRLDPDIIVSSEVRPIEVDGDERVGHFLVLTRER